MKWTPETATRGAIEGAVGGCAGEASVLSMACSVGHPTGVVDAAQVLLDELIHPEKCR